MKTIFFDMDGTLARFHDTNHDYVEAMWQEGFYKNLEPFENLISAINLLHENPDIHIGIISAYLETEPPFIQEEKKEWLRRHLPYVDDIRLVPANSDKSEYINEENAWLVDDYNKNLNEWRSAGNHSIKFVNDINDRGEGAYGGEAGNLWDRDKIRYSDTPEKIAADIVSFIDMEHEHIMDEPEDVLTTQLPEGWYWKEYEDGSGSLNSPDGKDYFSYDRQTQEYIDPTTGHWRVMENYPYKTPFSDFKIFAESWISKNILVKENIENQSSNVIGRHVELVAMYETALEIPPKDCTTYFVADLVYMKKSILDEFDETIFNERLENALNILGMSKVEFYTNPEYNYTPTLRSLFEQKMKEKAQSVEESQDDFLVGKLSNFIMDFPDGKAINELLGMYGSDFSKSDITSAVKEKINTKSGVIEVIHFIQDTADEGLPFDDNLGDIIVELSSLPCMEAKDIAENDKFALTNETKTLKDGTTVYRIVAKKSFADVTTGDFGGFVQSEDNLHALGNCWIYNDAIVCGNALVADNAAVMDSSLIRDNAFVCGNAIIKDNAIVSKNSTVADNAVVSGHALISDFAIVRKCANVSKEAAIVDCSHVTDHAKITDNALVKERAHVIDFATAKGNAQLFGTTVYGGNQVITGKERVTEATSVIDKLKHIRRSGTSQKKAIERGDR